MSRVQLLRGKRDQWSPWAIPRSRLAMWLHAGDSNLVSLTGSLVDSFTDRISGLAFTNTGTGRPEYVADGINGFPGIQFGPADVRLNNTSFSSVLPVGTEPSTIVVLGLSNNINALRARAFSYGSAADGRSVFVIDDGHNIGVSAVTEYQDTGSQISGPFVAIGEWSDDVQTVWSNGRDGGSAATTYNTATARASVGAGNSNGGADWFQGLIGDVLVIRGVLSTLEKQLISWWLLNQYNCAFDVLSSDNPYKPAAPVPYILQPNLVALDAQMTAAIGQPTPNTSPPMADPPTVTFQDASGLPPGLAERCEWTRTPGMLLFWGGWKFTTGGSFRRCPAGYLGLIDGVPFLLGTCMRMEVDVTDSLVGIHVLDSTQRYRVIINGQVIAVNGQDTTPETSWIILDFTGHGGSVRRNLVVEAESSNAIAGIAVSSTGSAFLPTVVPLTTLFVLGDSFTNATGATYNWLGFVAQLADLLGFSNFIADGAVGTGWLSRSNSTLSNALDRVDDVTDRNTYRRNSLNATGLSRSTCVLVPLGINDAGYSTVEIQRQANLVLDQIQQVIPGVPLLVTGPWNPAAPAAYSTSLANVNAGIILACAGRTGVAYINIENLVFQQVGNGNIHPTNTGHAQIATALAPLMRSAISSMIVP